MLQVQRDEPGALTELVRRHWMPIFRRFYQQLGDRHEAEDLAQEVFLRVYRARKRYQPRAKLTTWLFHISRNVARNAIRSRRRRPRVHGEHPVFSGTDDRSAEPCFSGRQEAPGEAMERAELAGVVRAAVTALAGRQRRALELHQFHDRTYNEIAAEMHIRPEAVKSLLYRARRQLRTSLTGLMETISGAR